MSAPFQITLSADDVRRWIVERDELLARAKDLSRKIDAAAVFLPDAVATAADENPGAPSLNDAVVDVIEEAERALVPKDIRLRLAAKGFTVGAENYIYTALKRLADRGKVLKTEHGYVSVSKGSSKEETPGQPAGGLFSANTPMGGAGGTAPEAGGT